MKKLFALPAIAFAFVVVTAGAAFAWPHSFAADATCDAETGHVLVTATFTNTSENETEVVTALGDTFTTQPGDTVTFGPSDLGEGPQPSGTVTVIDAKGNEDTATYPAVEECVKPSPSPSPSPSDSPTPTPTHNLPHPHHHNAPTPPGTAHTGSDTTGAIVVMLILAALGGVLFWLGRRARY